MRDKYHGRPYEQISTAVFKAGELVTGHGVSADKGKSIFLRDREAVVANFPFGSAAVHDNCMIADVARVLLHPLDAAIRVNGKQDQVTIGNVIISHFLIHNTGNHGKGQHILIRVTA
jgi:hypothetical protein